MANTVKKEPINLNLKTLLYSVSKNGIPGGKSIIRSIVKNPDTKAKPVFNPKTKRTDRGYT
jgi:hypothetical protein